MRGFESSNLGVAGTGFGCGVLGRASLSHVDTCSTVTLRVTVVPLYSDGANLGFEALLLRRCRPLYGPLAEESKSYSYNRTE